MSDDCYSEDCDEPDYYDEDCEECTDEEIEEVEEELQLHLPFSLKLIAGRKLKRTLDNTAVQNLIDTNQLPRDLGEYLRTCDLWCDSSIHYNCTYISDEGPQPRPGHFSVHPNDSNGKYISGVFQTKLLPILPKYLKFLQTPNAIWNPTNPSSVEWQTLNTYYNIYQKFLALQHKYPEKRLMPTREIEMIWQSHLIRSQNYMNDYSNCLPHKDRLPFSSRMDFFPVVDHDVEYVLDALESNDSSVFNETAELWQKEYNEPYTMATPNSCPISLQYFKVEDLQRDQEWWPHFLDYIGGSAETAYTQEWQEAAFAHYERFLYMSVRHRHKMLGQGATHEVDILWHLHMMHPHKYYKDSVNLLGFVLHHRPWPKREGDAPRDTSVQDALWLKEFGIERLCNRRRKVF